MRFRSSFLVPLIAAALFAVVAVASKAPGPRQVLDYPAIFTQAVTLQQALNLEAGWTNTTTGATASFTSATSAATATSSVAAITFAPTATLDADDLVCEVNSAAGTSLLSVDLEGDVRAAGDISLAGNDINGTGTGATLNIISSAADGTTSGTVGAITLKAGANITATDLVLDVQDSAAAHVFTCTEAGACVALTTLTATTDISAAGNDFNCSGTGATCNIVSSAIDGTTSGTVGAVTLKAGADITASDLLLDVQDSSANHALTVTEAGALTALTSVTATTTVTATTGLTVGGGTTVLKVFKGTCTDLDIGAAGAGAAAVVTCAVTDATAGDICSVVSDDDDAAWDEGGLTCFVEGAGSVKIVYHADASGGDPAATNDYNIMLLRF